MNTLRLFIYGQGASTVPDVSTKFNIDINDERNIKAISDLVSNPGPNPRTSDLSSSVASGIRKSIATNPFYGITTHGCDAVVESFRLGHNEKGEAYCDVAFDFDDEDSGQFNGAHNLWLVLDYMRETIKTNHGQFLPAHFILSSIFESVEQIRQMAKNKNRQVGIDTVSELNVLGYFEDLKSHLTPDLIKYMAWEQNEKQVGSSSAKKLATVTFKEALQIMQLTMYHYPSYSPKEKRLVNFDPEDSRKKIGSVPVEYFDPESTKTLAMAKTFGITADLLHLRDHMVDLLDKLAQKDPTLIILRNLATSKESDASLKFKSVLGGRGKTTIRTTGYFSRPDTAKYGTCPSFHRLFLFWFVKKCFKVCPETDELVYRDSWDYDLMVRFMDSSCERVARALEGLYRASWAENSMTEENWLIQKYVNASVFQKPFQMADEQFDAEYTAFLQQLPDQNVRRTLKRVEKASNG